MIPLSKSMETVKEREDRDVVNAIVDEISEYNSVLLNSTALATVAPSELDPEFVQGIWNHAFKRQEDQTVLVVGDRLLESFVSRFPALQDDCILAACKVLQPFGASLSMGLDDDGKISIASFMAKGVSDIQQVWNNSIFRRFFKTATQKEAVFLSLKDRLEDYQSVKGTGNDSLWRTSLKKCGLDIKTIQALLAGVSGIMLLGNEWKEDFSEACLILGMEPTVIKTNTLIIALFNRLIAKFVESVNAAIAKKLGKSYEDGVAEVASLVSLLNLDWGDDNSKQKVLHCAFDDNFAINSEMIVEGLPIPRAPRDVKCSLLAEGTVPTIEIPELETESVLYNAPLIPNDINFHSLSASSRIWTMMAIDSPQLSYIAKHWHFDEFVTRASQVDYTADFGHEEFFERYRKELFGVNFANLEQWATERGFSTAEFGIGRDRIWISEACWRYLETKRTFGYSPMIPQTDQFGGSSKRIFSNSDYGDECAVPFDYEEFDEKEPMYPEQQDVENEAVKNPVNKKPDYRRYIWLAIVQLFTWMIPSPFLSMCGLKSHDQRIAWREKVAICMMIALVNCSAIFYMIFLGKLLCPEMDHVWDAQQVGYHQGADDFYVSIQGKVYDLSKFYKVNHAKGVTADQMLEFAGKDMTPYFPKPLTVVCPGLVTDPSIWLTPNETVYNGQAIHYSGSFKVPGNSPLSSYSWYADSLQPQLEKLYKGDLVVKHEDLQKNGSSGEHIWATVNDKVYDLTDYFHTISFNNDMDQFKFLNQDLTDLFQNYAGEDITDKIKDLNLPPSVYENNMHCIDQVFYAGKVDFRESIRCQFTNYMLVAVAILLATVVLTKFLAALQLLKQKETPPTQNKFIVCHVPIYTEGEDEMRHAIDSLTSMDYANDKKLLFIVCDGMVIGHGNEHSTPSILLRIFGRDLRVENAVPKAYKAVGEGSKQLNYGQVYSGVYEHEGNLVPYLVVVKCGSERETHKPGNRGKRDSQLVALNFFNRVHHQTAMTPLELEMFHHLNNIIGVDPEFYEYLLMIDADTSVKADACNRLVAECTRDVKVAGVCGETQLANENESFWTMMQVYEYYISHHLTKAFESLFGSVTCLPGCFSMYRLRSQTGMPLIIHDRVIKDYYEVGVDTLHQQNLLSLGEDRFLTTLMVKHFGKMRYTFIPSAIAYTTAPSKFKVLLSQRRRWINSTVHNLVELLRIPDLCGFLFFGMRGFVFVDLAGTILLPSVCVYLGYLIYILTTLKSGSQFPLISVCTLGAVYGLQAILFCLKREWQHIGWLVFYLVTYPVHAFILPIYSFWKQDDFTWGSTRITEGGQEKLLTEEDDTFDERDVPRQLWTAYALVNGLAGAHRDVLGGGGDQSHQQQLAVDNDDTSTLYSMANSKRNSRAGSVKLGGSTSTLQHDDKITDEKLAEAANHALSNQDLELLTMNQVIQRVEQYLDKRLDNEQTATVRRLVDEYLD